VIFPCPVVDVVAHLPTRDVLEKKQCQLSLLRSRPIGKVNDSRVTVSVLPDRLMELLRMSMPGTLVPPITGKSASPKLPVMPMVGALEGPETLGQIGLGPRIAEQG